MPTEFQQQEESFQLARKLALHVASFRFDPPAGLEEIADVTWDRIRAVTLEASPSCRHLISFEIMDGRAHSDSMRRIVLPVAADHPSHEQLERMTDELREKSGGRTSIQVRVMVAFPGWEIIASSDCGRSSTSWKSEESLALLSGEWSDFTIQRSADQYGHGEYAANALDRAAAMLSAEADKLPIGYHRHWTSVDAEILRRIAETERRRLCTSAAA